MFSNKLACILCEYGKRMSPRTITVGMLIVVSRPHCSHLKLSLETLEWEKYGQQMANLDVIIIVIVNYLICILLFIKKNNYDT